MALPPHSTPDARACDEIEALLPLVADGSLDERQDPGLFDHLARCERCQDSLTTHDLVTLSLECRPREAAAPAPRVIRHSWTRFIPAAAAALLAVSATAWLTVPGAPAASSSAASPSVASAPLATHAPQVALKAMPKAVSPAGAPTSATPVAPAVVPAASQPVVASAQPTAITTPVDIEVEVVTVPGSSPSHPRYLVRRGEQVMLVDPTRPAGEAPADAKPASFRY